jgi:tight adherence protein B
MSRTRSRRALLLSVLLALVGLVIGVGAAGASAQEAAAESRFGIRSVDARDEDETRITFYYTGDRADISAAAVRVGGQLVDPLETPTSLATEQHLGISLLIDSSGTMNEGAAIERAREAALELIEAKGSADRMAILSFDDEVRVHQTLTTDASTLRSAVRSIAPGGDRALHDGIVRAAAMLETPEVQPSIVVLTGGPDVGSEATLDKARGTLASSGASLYSVVVDSGADGAAAAEALDRLAEASGGLSFTAAPGQISDAFGTIRETLDSQYVVRIPTPDVEGSAEVQLSVGSQQDLAQLTRGSYQEGVGALRTPNAADPSGPAFLRTTAGFILAIVLVVAAVGLAAYSLGSTFFGTDGSLDSVLRPYEASFGGPVEADDDTGATAMAQTQLLQRAVRMTEQFAGRRGLLETVENKLEKANLPLRPPEALFFYCAGVVVVTLLAMAITQSILPTLVVAVLAALVPPAIVNFRGYRRRKAFESLLPDTLQLLASTLKAGYSLMQGVEAVAHEVSEPMGRELRRVVTEARLGRPLEESLAAVADRMQSLDFGWAVMAIGIQREVGGNLSELLLTVAGTMTERERLRRDVSALTAEGRVSAMVLGLLPVGIAIFITGANPGYLEPLYTTTMGQVMIGAALVLAGIGGAWMMKIIRIEI